MNTLETGQKDLHVIFGAGPVGLTLADVLLAQGKQVRVVTRKGTSAPVGAEAVAADITDAGKSTQLCRGASAIYHCANTPYPDQVRVIPILQEAFIAVAAATGAKLIVTDTLYPYGETQGAPMTEDTPYAAVSRKGRMRAETARKYLQAHQEGRIQVALGRAADFYGPRVLNSSLGGFVFPAAVAGKPAQVLGNPRLPHAYSYIGDVARGLAALGERPEALGTWLLPVAPAVSTREMVRLIGKALGHPVGLLALPKFVIQAAGLFNPQMREMVEMFYQYTEPQIVDSSRFEAAFGWKATPPAEAIPATVAWFRAQAASAQIAQEPALQTH